MHTTRHKSYRTTMKAAAMRLFVSLVILLPLFTVGLATVTFVQRRSQLWMGRNLGALHELVDNEPPFLGSTLADVNHTDSNGQHGLVDFGNFWRKTRANFTACETPDRSPDFKSKGSGGSKYWDMGDHVIRHSNHWSGQHGIGRIVDCEWTIDIIHSKKEYASGLCRYGDFIKGKLSAQEKRKTRNKKR